MQQLPLRLHNPYTPNSVNILNRIFQTLPNNRLHDDYTVGSGDDCTDVHDGGSDDGTVSRTKDRNWQQLPQQTEPQTGVTRQGAGRGASFVDADGSFPFRTCPRT
jgi:hypothetical protein